MQSERPRRDIGSIVFGVLMLALGALAIQQTWTMSPMGGIFPGAVGVLLAIASVGLIVQHLLRSPAPANEREASEPQAWGRMFGLVVVLGAWAYLLPVLGFIVSSVLGFLGILATANYERWNLKRTLIEVAVAVAVIVLFYFVMVRVLYIPVPSGLFI